MRHCEKKSRPNSTICWCSLMHWTRKPLSHIGSLEHAYWAAVFMLHQYAYSISRMVHNFLGHEDNISESNDARYFFLECATDIDTDVSISVNTCI